MDKAPKCFHCERGEGFQFEPNDSEPTQVWRSSPDSADFPEILREQLRYFLEHLHPAYELVPNSVRYHEPRWHQHGFWEGYVEAQFRRRNGGRRGNPLPKPTATVSASLPSRITVECVPSRN